MTIFAVRHLTTYRYKRPVSFGRHRMMFRPRDSYDQRLISAEIEVDPEPKNVYWTHDVFGNCITTAEFGQEAAELSFLSNICLDHSPSSAPDFRIEDYARTYPFSYSPEEMPDLTPSIERRYADPEHAIQRWARRFLRNGGPTDTGMLLMTLTYAIRETLVYERRSETGTWNPALTLQLGRGSCRDFALLMIEAVRSLGLAARFVSGYIYVPSRDGPRILGGGSTHAWCQVYLPGAGWVEFDPTNGIVGNRDLIRVAVARDPSQAVPLSGTWIGAAEDSLGMAVEVVVRTVSPSPGSKPRARDAGPSGNGSSAPMDTA